MSIGYNPIPVINWATAVPSDTNLFHQQGELVFNSTPAKGGVLGWVCVADGYPGTWATFGSGINAGAVSSITAAAALSVGLGKVLLSGTAGTYTLAPALSHSPGFTVMIKNMSSGSQTLTPATGEAYADAAAITLAQFAVINLMSNGGTTWYKAA